MLLKNIDQLNIGHSRLIFTTYYKFRMIFPCNLLLRSQKKVAHPFEWSDINSKNIPVISEGNRTRIQPVLGLARHFAHFVSLYGTAWYCRVQPGTAWYSWVQPGTAGRWCSSSFTKARMLTRVSAACIGRPAIDRVIFR